MSRDEGSKVRTCPDKQPQVCGHRDCPVLLRSDWPALNWLSHCRSLLHAPLVHWHAGCRLHTAGLCCTLRLCTGMPGVGFTLPVSAARSACALARWVWACCAPRPSPLPFLTPLGMQANATTCGGVWEPTWQRMYEPVAEPCFTNGSSYVDPSTGRNQTNFRQTGDGFQGLGSRLFDFRAPEWQPGFGAGRAAAGDRGSGFNQSFAYGQFGGGLEFFQVIAADAFLRGLGPDMVCSIVEVRPSRAPTGANSPAGSLGHGVVGGGAASSRAGCLWWGLVGRVGPVGQL
eukprot:363096-Chlamydomonas_euryale.AAC.18